MKPAKPAQCHACGETVLSLKASGLKLLPKAVCQGCGRNVTKRGGRGELIGVLVFLTIALYASSGIQDLRKIGLIWFGVLVFAFYMEWWSWKSITWDPVEGQERASSEDGPERRDENREWAETRSDRRTTD